MPVLVLISRRDLSERNSPVTVGEFVWHDEHKRHLLQGRPLTGAEFNAFARSQEWDRAIERHGPRLRIEVVTTTRRTARKNGTADALPKKPRKAASKRTDNAS